jgi:hypothetical protein
MSGLFFSLKRCTSVCKTETIPPLGQKWTDMSLTTKILLYLIVLAALDTIIPIPITSLVLIQVLYQKPRWFKLWVDEVYRGG